MALNDTPRAARKARPKISLKMQAIGFLSRREHSRQELRAKLLAALRKREREEAAFAAAADAVAREMAEALDAQPSNGIDDAFAPAKPSAATPASPAFATTASSATSTVRGGRSRSTGGRARANVARAGDGDGAEAGAGTGTGASAGADCVEVGASAAHAPANKRGRGATTILDSLRLASGDPLPTRLRTNPVLAAATAVDADAAPASDVHGPAGTTLGGDIQTRRGIEDAIDIDADAIANAEFDESDPALERDDPEAVVDALLDWLVAHKYLSERRFVESRVNARARKQGAMMIKQELSRHGLALEPEQAAALRETEFARALAIWQRKFGAVGADARARAKQARFLAARGFASDVVRRIVGGEDES